MRADATGASATRGVVAKAVGEGRVATTHARGVTTFGVTTFGVTTFGVTTFGVTTLGVTTDAMRHGTTASRADRAP